MDVSNKVGPTCRRKCQRKCQFVVILFIALIFNKTTASDDFARSSFESNFSQYEGEKAPMYQTCAGPNCDCNSSCVHYSINMTGPTSYYCGTCGTLGSACSEDITCQPPGICQADKFCHCDRGEVEEEICMFYQPVVTSRGTITLIVFLLAILILTKLISSRKAVGRFLWRVFVCGCCSRRCRCCEGSYWDEENIQVSNPESGTKSAAFTMSSREFICNSADSDLGWVLDLSPQATGRASTSTNNEEAILFIPGRASHFHTRRRRRYSFNQRESVRELMDDSSNNSSFISNSSFNADSSTSYSSSSNSSLYSAPTAALKEAVNSCMYDEREKIRREEVIAFNENEEIFLTRMIRNYNSGNSSSSSNSTSSHSFNLSLRSSVNSSSSSSSSSSSQTAHPQTSSILSILGTDSLFANYREIEINSIEFDSLNSGCNTTINRTIRLESNASSTTTTTSDSCVTFTTSRQSSFSSARSWLSRTSTRTSQRSIEEGYVPAEAKIEKVRNEVSLPLVHALRNSYDNFTNHLRHSSSGSETMTEESYL